MAIRALDGANKRCQKEHTSQNFQNSLWEEVICVVRLNFEDLGYMLFLTPQGWRFFLKLGQTSAALTQPDCGDDNHNDVGGGDYDGNDGNLFRFKC